MRDAPGGSPGPSGQVISGWARLETAAVILRADHQPAAALGEFDTENSADRGSTPRTSTLDSGLFINFEWAS